MKIGLLGFGTVGGGVYTLLQNNPDMEIKYIMCLEDINLPGIKACRSFKEILQDPSIDTVIEVMGGEHPAYDAVRAALESGRNVITANKAMVSRHFGELNRLARESGASFRFTAAAGGGIPWLTNLERARRMEKVIAVSGIVNGTCNYILDTMATLGLRYDEALANAQSLGYAEADPTADVDGWDSQHKLILSCNIAFDADLDPTAVPVAGIRNISAQDIAQFKERNLVCRLIINGRRTEKGVAAFVEPELVPQGQLPAGVPLNNNLITLVGENIGTQSFYGQGAGRAPTAYNVVQDCLDVWNRADFPVCAAQSLPVDNGAVLRRYYVCGAQDGFLKDAAEESWGRAVVTRLVSVEAMHAWAREAPGPVFFAALPE